MDTAFKIWQKKYTKLCKCVIIIIIIIIIIIVAALLKLPRPAPSSLAPLCLPPPSTDDLLGLRFFFAFACLFAFISLLAPTGTNTILTGALPPVGVRLSTMEHKYKCKYKYKCKCKCKCKYIHKCKCKYKYKYKSDCRCPDVLPLVGVRLFTMEPLSQDFTRSKFQHHHLIFSAEDV